MAYFKCGLPKETKLTSLGKFSKNAGTWVSSIDVDISSLPMYKDFVLFENMFPIVVFFAGKDCTFTYSYNSSNGIITIKGTSATIWAFNLEIYSTLEQSQ